MSIEVMKRIKSLLQDGDKIDSHTISAVVAECDAVILTQQPDNASCKSVQKRHQAQQPATDEPVAYMWQHDETGRTGFVEADQLAMGWRDANPRLAIVAPCYTHPAPGVPDDVARDAERFRCLNLTEEAIAVADSMLAAK